MENVRKLVENRTYSIDVESIEEEIERCARMFHLSPDSAHKYANKHKDEIARQRREGMEGIFAVPSVTKLSIVRDVIPMERYEYHFACFRTKMMLTEKQLMKDGIRTKDNAGRPRTWQLESDAIRAKWRASDKQPGQEIILISAQLGKEHVGCSYNEASLRMFSNERGEFPLDFCAFGSILLLHPERMRSYKDLGVNIFGTKITTKNKFGVGDDCVPFMRMSPNGLVLSQSPYNGGDCGYTYGIPSGIVI